MREGGLLTLGQRGVINPHVVFLLCRTYLRVVVCPSLHAHTHSRSQLLQRLIHCARRPHQLSPSSITPPTGRSWRLELIAGKLADSISSGKELVVVCVCVRVVGGNWGVLTMTNSLVTVIHHSGGKRKKKHFFLFRYAAHSNKICHPPLSPPGLVCCNDPSPPNPKASWRT